MEEKKWQKYTSLGDIPVAEEGEALSWVKKQHGMGILMLAGQDTLRDNVDRTLSDGPRRKGPITVLVHPAPPDESFGVQQNVHQCVR